MKFSERIKYGSIAERIVSDAFEMRFFPNFEWWHYHQVNEERIKEIPYLEWKNAVETSKNIDLVYGDFWIYDKEAGLIFLDVKSSNWISNRSILYFNRTHGYYLINAKRKNAPAMMFKNNEAFRKYLSDCLSFTPGEFSGENGFELNEEVLRKVPGMEFFDFDSNKFEQLRND